MAQAYWKSGATAEATFSLFIRNYPPDRGYLVAAGVEDALDYLAGLRFSRDDIDYLRSIGSFDAGFLDFLAGVRFTGSVRGMDDGSIFFTDEPVLEVTAPVIEGQIVETRLVNLINLHCILATKAARVAEAARGREVVDFAARRTQGAEAARRRGESGLHGRVRRDQQRAGRKAPRYTGLRHHGALLRDQLRERAGGVPRVRDGLPGHDDPAGGHVRHAGGRAKRHHSRRRAGAEGTRAAGRPPGQRRPARPVEEGAQPPGRSGVRRGPHSRQAGAWTSTPWTTC